MSKVIAHIDLNAFFASVEQIEQPHLRGKPVAVGVDGRRGMVVTASYEARHFGVKAGMPTYQAKALCPSLIIVEHDFDAYHRYSERFKKFIQQYASKVEMGSIDECFADFSHIDFSKNQPVKYFEKIQKQLLKELQLPSSWGIAPTKFLAKMASDFKKPMGLTLLRKRDIPSMLYPLPVETMYGIGKKTYPKLIKQGIKKIGDLVDHKHEEPLRSALGKFYFTVQSWLKGEGSDEVDDQEHDPKSIGNSTTLDANTDDFSVIQPILHSLTEEVYERAKKQHLLAKTLTLTIKRPDFKVYTRSITLEESGLSLSQLVTHFKKLFLDHFSAISIRLIGVSLHQLIQEDKMTHSISLFDPSVTLESHNQTQALIETINVKFKKKIIKRASDIK
jgi:DNA polymerase-4